MKLAARERRLAVATAVVAAVAVVWTFAIQPFVERWRAVEAERAATAEALERARALAARVEPLRAEWETLEKAMGPGGSEAVPRFLADIRGRAQAAGLSPKDIHFLRVETRGDFDEALFEVRARAPIGTLARFLYEMRESEAFVKVSRLSLTSPADGRGDLEIAMAVSTIGAKGRKP